MEISAALVKKLREETDAPMMECKAALVEANGDFARAKDILREKGQAAAAKRADRATGAGFVAVATRPGAIAGVVVESETDFVSNNPDFRADVQRMVDALLANGKPNLSVEEALEVTDADGKSLKTYTEELVGKIRENIVLRRAVKLEGGHYGYYVHHDAKSGAIIELSGENAEVGKDVGMQVVSMHPEFLTKDELPQDRMAKEMELEIERAIKDGKPAEMAEKIAAGRVNKEFVKSIVLLEQGFVKDQSKTVSAYLAESGGIKVLGFHKLRVGAE